MAEAAELEDAGLARTAKDLFAGAAGGVAQVLMGQPFDIIKVRLQTSSEYKNALDCATKIYKNEGPLAFYKGTLTPLVGIGACVSVQFGAFHTARRYFESLNLKRHPTSPPSLSYTQFYLSGAMAGLANTVLSSPIEHVRIRLQTQPHSPRLYTSPIDCIRKLSSASNGGVTRGLYRGTSITLFREAQAYGFWFLTFEYLMAWDLARGAPLGRKREDIPGWKVAAYGGLAGEALWISSYPFDVVKSQLQSDGLGKEARFKGVRDCAGQIYGKYGVGGFWRGIGPTLLRAMPVSAGTFAVVEATMRALN